jgi:hypothetical protein
MTESVALASADHADTGDDDELHNRWTSSEKKDDITIERAR